MSDTIAGLREKISSANDLQTVVRSMKALAASNVGQYEKSVLALTDYTRTVELGLGASFRVDTKAVTERQTKEPITTVGAVVFGSDQGLVGRFNDVIAESAIDALKRHPRMTRVWAVGERVHARLVDAGLPLEEALAVPGSIQGITPLVGQILVASQTFTGQEGVTELYIFHNRPAGSASYEPTSQRLLPLDESWKRDLVSRPWPTQKLPEAIGSHAATLQGLIGEYLFISLFRACAESLAAENASRLAAMQRADKNIDDLLENLNGTFHGLRQSEIDEELFDVISGFEALKIKK